MATTNRQVRTGNRIEVQIDGKRIGLMQSCRMSDDYGLEAASGIGDIHVVEHVPTMARHALSVSFMVLDRGAMIAAGVAPENGDGALQGLVFDVVSLSKDDSSIIRKYRGCSYASGDLEVTKHAIVMQSGQLMALDVSGAAV